MQDIRYTHSVAAELDHLLPSLSADRLFVLTDSTTEVVCTPLIASSRLLADAPHITIGAGATYKHLDSLAHVWKSLGEGGATRHSALVCLGGGMVTDLGGFAAATFKRGIRFVHVPTTLLSMVDAAVGGKTGINFNGLKNEVGAFCNAAAVVVCTDFLRSLDAGNLCSGYAEMLKHALLENSSMLADHLRFDPFEPDYVELQRLVRLSIQTKQRIVEADPREQGIRKALNLGHTVGHAFESLALERKPVLHGYAVAWGMACELYLSALTQGFDTTTLHSVVHFIRAHYGRPDFSCDDYERLYDLMRHDKKNVGSTICFTLLGGVGDVRLDCHVTREQVFDSFDFLREA